MKSMTPLASGLMVSLTVLAALVSSAASAQPPQAGAPGWRLPRAEWSRWPGGAAPLAGRPPPAAPRGNLRGDITDNARQRASTPHPHQNEPRAPRH